MIIEWIYLNEYLKEYFLKIILKEHFKEIYLKNIYLLQKEFIKWNLFKNIFW